MRLEIYQIVVPIISAIFIWGLASRFRRSRASMQEVVVGSLFWLAVAVFALFPDFFSRKIARLFGIKSNINAIIFFCLGLIFFFQYKLFFMIKKQQMALTNLTRKIALEQQPDKEVEA
ncbi:MAG: DUF2304 domain-containing protein [Phaeodactylibacter sp.]|nr:DUF2304 domain-containing protein [Phaeodactylibacter sp.]MCB9274876.1 DUF2304 domain-containing protein [Lewinellaceae bacterium]